MLPVFLAPGPMLRGLVTLDEAGIEGRGRNGEAVEALLRLVDLPSLFEDDERTDAHVVAYCVKQDGEPLERQPRLNKEVLAAILERGYTVEAHTVWIDLDLHHLLGKKSKVKWTELTDSELGLVWQTVEEAHTRLAQKGMAWTASYTTSGGLRFVHALALPVPIGDGYEALLSRFHAAYQLAGLPADEACRDWTRLYRAPRVIRDGEPTSTQPWFSSHTDFDDDTTYYVPRDEDLVPPEKSKVVPVVRIDRDRPDPEEARALIEILDGTTGQWKLTVVGKKAKAALKDSQAFDVIYNRIPIAREGRRHDTLTRVVGEVVGHVHGTDWGTAEVVYALLYDAAGRLGEEEDWLGKVWEMATTFWDRETARKATKAAAVEQKVAKIAEVTETERQRFLRGCREWLSPLEGLDDEAAIDFVRQNRYGVAMDARRDLCHVLMPTGFYDDHVCTHQALAKVIEQRGMDWLVPTVEARDDGRGNVAYVPLAPAKIIQRSARVYTAEEIKLDARASYVQTDWQGRDVFVDVPFALRDDVQAERVEPIMDFWLAAAGGDKNRRDEILVALASLLLFRHGPTAAVLLWGEASAGKSLTATSLGECLTTRRLADGAALVDNFNDSIRKSPIIHIEEASDRGNKGIDASVALRRIITAPWVSVEQKGRDKLTMQGVHRVLLTANSKDIIYRMMGSQARTGNDWRAIGERLAEFRIDDGATRWFEEHNAGWGETKKWIGRHGRTGLYARFWFWVLKHMIQWQDGEPLKRGRRLLYEGNCASATVRHMEANAGAVPEVVCALNKLIGLGGKPKVKLHNGYVFFTTQAVIEEATSHRTADTRAVREALESLIDPTQPADERITVQGKQARWRRADAKKIVRLIEMHTTPDPIFNVILNPAP